MILDLFSAGTETTGTSLDWALLYMIAYPEIQQECYNEIEKVHVNYNAYKNSVGSHISVYRRVTFSLYMYMF